MNKTIDIGDGLKSIGFIHVADGIKSIKVSIEKSHEPLTLWYFIGCSRGASKFTLIVNIQTAGVYHDLRYNVSENFAEACLAHITKQVKDHNNFLTDLCTFNCGELDIAFDETDSTKDARNDAKQSKDTLNDHTKTDADDDDELPELVSLSHMSQETLAKCNKIFTNDYIRQN
jgi:hypothetical protein